MYDSGVLGLIGVIMAALGAFSFIIALGAIASLVALVFIYRKFGYMGWEAVFPGYNIICLMNIVEFPEYYAWAMFIPLLHIVFPFIVAWRLAKCFGAPTWLCILTVIPLTSCIGYCIIAFGKYDYIGME